MNLKKITTLQNQDMLININGTGRTNYLHDIFLMLPIKFEIENICCFNFNIYERLGLGHEIAQKSLSDCAKIALCTLS